MNGADLCFECFEDEPFLKWSGPPSTCVIGAEPDGPGSFCDDSGSQSSSAKQADGSVSIGAMSLSLKN